MTAIMTPFVTISIAKMDTLTFPETRYLIEDLIAAGSANLFVGPPKRGKSLFLIDALASIAAGDTFLGKATISGPVIYVPAEDGFPVVRNRLRTRFGDERSVPFYILPVDGSLPDQTLQLDNPESLARLAATIEAIKPVAVGLDCLRELHTLKENDADEMALLLRPIRQLAHETDTAIILVHHRNKHGTDPATATRGSSAIVGAVDSVLTLDASGNDEDGLTPQTVITLTAQGRYGPKQRITAHLASGLRWEIAGAAPDTTLANRIPYLLGGRDTLLDADAIAEALGAKKGSVQNALKELVKSGAVVRLGKGEKNAPYQYAHPRVAADMTQRDEWGNESQEKAHDEPYDEYFPGTQGKMPIRHSPNGSIPPPR
jgi:hypothetical protein